MTAELETRGEVGPILPQWARVGGPTVAAAVLAVGLLLWFTVELLRGYFFQDDYVFFYLGGTVPLGELLLRDYNGRLQPGAFLLGWLLAHTAPLVWPVAVLPVIAMQAASLVLCWRLLGRLFGRRWAIVVPFAMIAFSPLTFGLSLWWAYALQLLPVQLAMLGAINAHVAYLRQPTRWRVAQGLLFTLLGLAFWEKAALIPPVLFGLTLVLASAGGGFGPRLTDTVRRHGRLWLGYVALLVGYGAVHLWRASLDQSYRPTGRELVVLTRDLVGDGLVPALFGGPWSGDWVGFRGLALQDGWVLGVTWTAAAVVVLLGLWLGRLRAALAWLTLGGYLAASVLMIAFSRLGGEWRAIIGTDTRYIADAVPVAVLCAALALLRPRTQWVPEAPQPTAEAPDAPSPAGDASDVPSTADEASTADVPRSVPSPAGDASTPDGRRLPRWLAALASAPDAPRTLQWLAGGSASASDDRRPLRWLAAGTSLVLTAAFVAGAATSIAGALPEQRHQPARDYVENVRAALELEPELVLYDTAVPSHVLIALLGDQPLASRTLLGLRMRVDQPSEDLRILDSTGIPRKIGLVNGVPGRPGPVKDCGYLVGPQFTRVPLAHRAEGKRLVAHIGFYAQTPSNGTISTPNQQFAVRFEAGLHHISIVADGPFTEFLIQAEAAACITDVLVGEPLPHPN